jgi:hypothetical protein
LLTVEHATTGPLVSNHSNMMTSLPHLWKSGWFVKQFQCNCNKKLFGSGVWPFLHPNNSSTAASLVGCQFSNGLVESHWKIMVHMFQAYLMEKQMLGSCWYISIEYTAQIMNMVQGKYRSKPGSPFMIVQGVPPD